MKMDVIKLVEDEVRDLRPEFVARDFLPETKKIAKDIQTAIDKNDDIYKHHEMYDLQWAFKDSQENINHYVKEVFGRADQKMKELCENNKELYNKYKKKVTVTRRFRVKKMIYSFVFVSNLVSFLDVFISFLMVIAISELTHLGDSFLESALLGAIFLGITSLFKVTLDKYYITPRIHRWGWSKYKDINEKYKQNIVKIIAVLFIVNRISEDIDSNIIEESEPLKFIEDVESQIV